MATIKERYDKQKNTRQPYLDRAEECAKHTIPYAFIEDTLTGQDDLERYFSQGYGAMLVKHIVGKLALSILPPSQPFYRLAPTQEALEVVAGNDTSAVYEIEKLLARKEEACLRIINKSNFRASLYPSLVLSVITGNAIVEKTDKGYIVHNLRNFTTKRDYNGEIIELIIVEKKDFTTLPTEFQSSISDDDKEDELELYTLVERQDDGTYIIKQEIVGEDVGEEITIKNFNEMFIDVGWNKIDGEHYRRSFVEDYLGSFISLEKLETILYEGVAEKTKIVKFMNPNGMTDIEDYKDANHGDVISGEASDLTSEDARDIADERALKELIDGIKQELARAFLVTGSSIRDSERTTAYEVQQVASEVEASLGGIYTYISDNIQRPLVIQSMSEVDISEDKDIDIIITTGIQALGRNVELSKINNMINQLGVLASVTSVEEVAKYLNVGNIISSIIANSGVASKEFIYSPKDMDAIEKAKKEEAIAQQMLQGGLPQAGMNIANQTTQGGQNGNLS